jgi:hypothetical protein
MLSTTPQTPTTTLIFALPVQMRLPYSVCGKRTADWRAVYALI